MKIHRTKEGTASRSLVGFLLAVWLFLASCGGRTPHEEAAAYASQLEFRNVRLSASENFAGQTVHYLEIDVHNRGQRAVRQLEVLLSFRNAQGPVVLSERATAISPRTRPLGAGQKRSFRLGFDPPAEWNRQRPEISIASLLLE